VFDERAHHPGMRHDGLTTRDGLFG
jgi:hypothetical protein